MEKGIIVLTTAGSAGLADKIAAGLVEQRLAACVQVVGPVKSLYWWRGNIENAQEWQCVIKTRIGLYERVENAIRQMHDYEVPEIIWVPILGGHGAYLDWIRAETVAGNGKTVAGNGKNGTGEKSE